MISIDSIQREILESLVKHVARDLHSVDPPSWNNEDTHSSYLAWSALFIYILLQPYRMTENFRKSVLNRLPTMPPPMAPTKAPWAQTAGDDVEELDGEGEGQDDIGELGAA